MLRHAVRRFAFFIGIVVPAFVVFVYAFVLPQMPAARDGMSDGLSAHTRAVRASFARVVTELALTMRLLATIAAVLGVVIGGLSAGGHLVARYLRRQGQSRLPGAIGRWADRQRARRAPTTLEIVLGRDDRAMPYEVSKFFDGLAGTLRPARWYSRLLFGADTITPKLVNDPSDRRVRLAIAVRADAAAMVEHRLRATYPDVRLRPIDLWGASTPRGPWTAAVARLRGEVPSPCPFTIVRVKKTRRWILALQSTRDYQHSVVEALVATMAGSGQPCAIDLALTPAPALIERLAARTIRKHEQALKTDAAFTPTSPGVHSTVAQKHLQGAVESVSRSLFFFDLRIVVPAAERTLAHQLAGVVREARADNSLRPHTMRVRRRLYAARVARSTPPALPALRTGIVSTAELATLWHLPTLRLRSVGLERSGARQLAADPSLSRDRRDMVLRDEHGPVGLRARDRLKGWAIMGAPGGGKSALVLRHLGNVARDRSRSLIVIDPKVDLAQDALTAIPNDRVVHYLDLAHPYAGFNPLTALRERNVSPEVVADIVVAAIRESGGEGSVGARSDQFLRNALMAVCTVEDEPSLYHAYRMLDPNDFGYRDWVVRELEFHPEAEFLRDFWGRRFQARAATNARFLDEIMEAPSNKLARILEVPSLGFLTSHPVQLDLAGIVDRHEVLIVNGSKGTVGEDNAILICQLIVLMVQRLLHQQQDRDRGQRNDVELLIDEGHNMFQPSFATLLSEGRSAGIHVAVVFQYSGQIEDPRVKAGIRSLLQNISIFRMREFEDARAVAALCMEVFADNIRGEELDSQRVRFDPTDIVNLPDHRCLNLWLADGVPRSAFTASTIAIEPTIERAGGAGVARTHLRRQRQRGWHPHDRGGYMTMPSLWTIEAPALVIDRPLSTHREVAVDITAWRDRPARLEDARILLRSTSGETVGFAATPADSSGRRLRAHVSADPAASSFNSPGEYEVRVLVPAAEAEWAPTVLVAAGRHAHEVPATVRLPAPGGSDGEVDA